MMNFLLTLKVIALTGARLARTADWELVENRSWPIVAGVLLTLAVLFTGCAAHQPPVSLTGQGRTLWYANEVVVGLNTIQHTAIELNKIPICEPSVLAPTLDSTAPVVGTDLSAPPAASDLAPAALAPVPQNVWTVLDSPPKPAPVLL